MLWPLITGALFAIFAWADMFRHLNSFLDHVFFGFFFAFFTFLAALVGVLIALLVGLAFPKKWNDPEVAVLASLRNDNGVHGTFFLGSGSVGTEQYYFFYRKVGEGYQPDRIVANDSVMIYEEERTDGTLKTYDRDFSLQSAWLVAVGCWSPRYEFYIPKGSLKQDFVLR